MQCKIKIKPFYHCVLKLHMLIHFLNQIYSSLLLIRDKIRLIFDSRS